MSTASEPRRSGAQSRELILNAAERLFAERGYRGTSLEEVGRAAGLSRATPAYFFGSKHGLYGEVLTRILERAKAALEPVYDSARNEAGDVEEVLTRLVDAHLNLLSSDPALARLVQWEALTDEARLVRALHERREPLVELLQELARRAGAEALTQGDADELILEVAGLCWLPFTVGRSLASNDHELPVAEARRRRVVRFLLLRLREHVLPGEDTGPTRSLNPPHREEVDAQV